MSKNFYLTTTLPYVNAEPHIGFALEIVQADVIARFKKLEGFDVFFNFGTDEHGLKIYRKAQESGKDPQDYVDEYAKKFDALKEALNLSYNSFIRTTDAHHIKAAQEFWKRCLESGDIYKKLYKIKYCVGCELEKTESELIDGKCPIHPNLEIEIIDEENYFFRFSKYQDKLLELYKNNPDFVIPEGKFNEIKAFVKNGLEDFSVSRLKTKMPWGIDVPDDPDHIMFVWFDALVNYVSAIGWPEDLGKFEKWWPVVQFAGKDNLRQQSAIWQAMLFSAGLPPSKQIFIHGFVTANGQKISKSLGNVIDPIAVSKKYGTDALRYYLLAKIHPWEDSDFTFEKFEETYNADLANGLGNLVSRVAKLCEENNVSLNEKVGHVIDTEISSALTNFEFNSALSWIWLDISKADKKINDERPWELDENKVKPILIDLIKRIQTIAFKLKPFLPETSEKIEKIFEGPEIKSSSPLFPRF
ncbi:methionine--tRNA ligase [Candidatus Woesebacteria bacterium]|nr:methionine--tRNA ligase [Candidatus Woesebacteria bacterium]